MDSIKIIFQLHTQQFLKITEKLTGGVAEWLRLCIVLPKALSSVSSTQLTTACNSSPKGTDALFWPSQAPTLRCRTSLQLPPNTHIYINKNKTEPGWWSRPLNPGLKKQRQEDLCEFEDTVVYKVNSGTARVTQRNPGWKNQTNKQTKN